MGEANKNLFHILKVILSYSKPKHLIIRNYFVLGCHRFLLCSENLIITFYARRDYTFVTLDSDDAILTDAVVVE